MKGQDEAKFRDGGNRLGEEGVGTRGRGIPFVMATRGKSGFGN